MGRDIITNKKDIGELFIKGATLVMQARQRVAAATVNVEVPYRTVLFGLCQFERMD